MRGRNSGVPDNGDTPLLAETAPPSLRPPQAPGSPWWSRAVHRREPSWLRALLVVAIVVLATYLLAVRAGRLVLAPRRCSLRLNLAPPIARAFGRVNRMPPCPKAMRRTLLQSAGNPGLLLTMTC